MQDVSLFDAVPKREAPSAAAEASEDQKADQIAWEREKLERRLANGELDDTRTRVAFVLNQYPTCRNSDIDLSIRYWRIFHPEEVGSSSISFDALRVITPMTSITRARATIQNTFGLFVPDEAVSEFREEREGSVRRRQRAARATSPFVHVYCDESGKTDRHYVVGSLWVNDTDEQAYKLFRDLNEWRKSVEWTSEIHFVDATNHRKDAYLDFVRRAMRASEYVGFKAVVLSRDDVKRRPTEDAIFNLYYRLVVDGVQHELDTGRFALPRAVAVQKDEDEGADKLHLLALRDRLRTECPKQFDNQVEIAAVNSLKSSSNVLMQLADVFTGSVSRVVNRSEGAGRNHKDYVAEGVLRLLGADPSDIDRDVTRDFVRIIRL